MNIEHRDRAEGWKHAKLSGHENERLLEELVCFDNNTQKRLLGAAHKESLTVTQVSFGGLHEKNVPSVFGDTTKSKTDMCIHISDGSCVNVSIKKCHEGQVYLISPDRFVRGFELQYGIKVPEDVIRAIYLYWGFADDTREIVNKLSKRNKSYELRKHRLVARTLERYDRSLADRLIGWFNENMPYIFDFCFSRGLAKNEEDWAELVWYRNALGENTIDKIFNIRELESNIPQTASFGTRTGGSTIKLPFGSVQWHSPTKIIPGDMQFRHDLNKLYVL